MSMFFFVLYYAVQGESFNKMFDEYYFRRTWSMTFDYFHSIPIAFVGLLIGLCVWYYYNKDIQPNPFSSNLQQQNRQKLKQTKTVSYDERFV